MEVEFSTIFKCHYLTNYWHSLISKRKSSDINVLIMTREVLEIYDRKNLCGEPFSYDLSMSYFFSNLSENTCVIKIISVIKRRK